MIDILRIIVYLVSFAASIYALSGYDFKKHTRPGAEQRMFLLYLLCSMALAFLVSEFVLGLSI